MVYHQNKKGKFRICLTIFLVVLLIVSALGYFYTKSFVSPSLIEGEDIQEKLVKDNGVVNILITGVDAGDPKSKSKNDPKRTDTILLVNYNNGDKKINIISIPRDTLVNIKGKNHKINILSAIGGDRYLIEYIEKTLGITVNYFGKINYQGFREIVDVIGGVDMNIKNNMYYDDDSQNLHIHFTKGQKVHLDGKKAEEFFRWRKNNDGTGLALGDLGRIENQHEFINKVIEKFRSPEIIPKIPNIFETVNKYSYTNMNFQDIIKYGYKFIKVDRSNVNVITLQGDTKYINGISYFIYEKEKNLELLNMICEYDENYNNPKKPQIN